jgi:diaminopimelate epimerase
MLLSFSKYQGAGNDFIIIDDRFCQFPVDDRELIQRLCFRNLGIGADGLILLQHSSCAEFRMRIFNADGKEASMCGNGLRCLVKYLKDLGFKAEKFRIETEAKVLECSYHGGKVSVNFPSPKVLHWGISLQEGGISEEIFVVDTGVPHAVIFVEDLEGCLVEKRGRELRLHPKFSPHGVNVNFVKVTSDGTARIRTYERGVEGETLACGTGAAAVAFVLFEKAGQGGSIRVMPKSGESLEFLAENPLKGIEMRGNAEFVFEGGVQI